MATVSEGRARQIIAHDGYYFDDPRVMQVVTYTNIAGGKCWAILYARDVQSNRYAPSRSVINPKIEWTAE